MVKCATDDAIRRSNGMGDASLRSGALFFMVALFSQWCYIVSGHGVSTNGVSQLTVNRAHENDTSACANYWSASFSRGTFYLSFLSVIYDSMTCDECEL